MRTFKSRWDWGRPAHFDAEEQRVDRPYTVWAGVGIDKDHMALRDIKVMSKTLPDAVSFATNLMHKCGLIVDMTFPGSDVLEEGGQANG